MLFAFLEFGTLWFWAAAILPFFFLIYLVENEKAVGAILTVIATVAAFIAFGDKGIVPWIFHNPLKLLGFVAGYVVAGVAWGVVKWFFHVLRSRDKYEAVRKDFVANAESYRNDLRTNTAAEIYRRNNGGGVYSHDRRNREEREMKAAIEIALAEPVPEGFDKELFKTFAQARHSLNLSEFPPSVGKNRSRIIFWMSYWPASALWTLLNDPITRFYRMLYNRLAKLFEGITTSLFGKYKDDFVTSK